MGRGFYIQIYWEFRVANLISRALSFPRGTERENLGKILQMSFPVFSDCVKVFLMDICVS